MAANHLTPQARLENVRALALAAGLSAEQAAERLAGRVLCTFDDGDKAACEFYRELAPILSRTIVTESETSDGHPYLTELVIGNAKPRTDTALVFASLGQDSCCFSKERQSGHDTRPVEPLLALIAACYASGVAIHRAVGDGLPNPPPDTLIIDYEEIVPDRRVLSERADLGHAYLAGAGAIGNGLLWAARHMNLHGSLTVCDDDTVSSGNLQRQVWFDEEDIGQPKSPTLCAKAQRLVPNCNLFPVTARLQDLPDRKGAWLNRLIVAVDSRRARRELQNELPLEVVDASTTDVREIVLHYNNAREGLACMGCLYKADEKELSQDQVIADHLGVNVEHVKSARISSSAALAIVKKHAHLAANEIEGLAYDSLYKELCSTGKLHDTVGKQVVAPFAFVSVLAGVLLLLEVVHRLARPGQAEHNEWRVSPWREPFREGRYTRLRLNGCECCGKSVLQRLRTRLWA